MCVYGIYVKHAAETNVYRCLTAFCIHFCSIAFSVILGKKAALNDTRKAIERLKICQIKSSWIKALFDHKARGFERPC